MYWLLTWSMYVSPKMYHIKEVAIWGCIYCTTISVSFLFILFGVFQMMIIWFRKKNVYYLKNINYNKVINLFFLSISKVCANLISVQEVYFWGVCVLGGICPGGKCPGGKCSGGKCPGGKCPGGYVLRATNMFLWFQCKFYAQSYDGRPNGLRIMSFTGTFSYLQKVCMLFLQCFSHRKCT